MLRIVGLGFFACLFAWFGLHAATPLQSASFDCAKASHPLEKTICASPKLSKLDGEVAALYRARLAQLFDKESFRSQQRDWQQLLRTRCAKRCDPAAVETDYTRQRDTLNHFDEETWEASYKTSDVATLTITHIDGNAFDFALIRDREGKELCKLPANDSEAGAVATRVSPVKSSWSAGRSSRVATRIVTLSSMAALSRTRARLWQEAGYWLPATQLLAGRKLSLRP